MKTLLKTICFFLLLMSYNLFSQNLFDQNSNVIENYFNTLQNTQKVTPKTNPFRIGSYSDIKINQKGNYNNSYIVTGKNKKQSVNQKGNNNNYEYYSYYNSIYAQVNSIQIGSNNDIQIFGQNQLSKNINIIQNTNNKTLIIKNY